MNKRFYYNLSRIFIVALLAFTVFISASIPVSACEISVKTDGFSGEVGDEAVFIVKVELTHRNCTVPIEETYLTFVNMSYVSQTAWQPLASNIYVSEVRALLTTEGEGLLTVDRICPTRGGDTITVSYLINKAIQVTATPSSNPLNPAAPISDITNVAVEPGDINSNISNGLPAPAAPAILPAEKTWGQAFEDVFSQAYVYVYFLLVLFAYIAFRKGQKRWRYVSLTFAVVYLGFFLGLCPSALGSMQTLLREGADVKTHLLNYVILGIPVISTIFFGRLFCGWVCPMGAVQQIIYRKDIAVKVPQKIHDTLKYLKYVVLAATIYAVFATGTNAFCNVDPFKSLFNLQIEPVNTSLLVVLLLASLVIFAPWCKYICPLGALLALVAKLSRNKLHIAESCKNCKACSKAYCDYSAIGNGENTPDISDMECVRCGTCGLKCPKKSIVYTKAVGQEKQHKSGIIAT